MGATTTGSRWVNLPDITQRFPSNGRGDSVLVASKANSEILNRRIVVVSVHFNATTGIMNITDGSTSPTNIFQVTNPGLVKGYMFVGVEIPLEALADEGAGRSAGFDMGAQTGIVHYKILEP